MNSQIDTLFYTGSMNSFLKLRNTFDEFKTIIMSCWGKVNDKLTNMINANFSNWHNYTNKRYILIELKPGQSLKYYYEDCLQNTIAEEYTDDNGNLSIKARLYVDNDVCIGERHFQGYFWRYYINCSRDVPPHPDTDSIPRTALIRCNCGGKGGKCKKYPDIKEVITHTQRPLDEFDDEDDKGQLEDDDGDDE